MATYHEGMEEMKILGIQIGILVVVSLKPLPIAVTTDEEQYRFVEDNNSYFIRLISNEVGKTILFYYANWQDVHNEYKQTIYELRK
ncbi:hypothetical protein R6Q59_003179 [Mikania micrantha]